MIIDAHAHIYPDAVAGKAIGTIIGKGEGRVEHHSDGTYDGLRESMERAGIDYSVVLPVATGMGQGENILQWIRRIAPLSNRFIFFGSVHPHDPECINTIKKIRDEGLRGIKFHPGYQGFKADSAEAFRVYEEAAKNDLVLHFHSGLDPSLRDCDDTSIERFGNVIRSFAGAKIVLAHAGGMDEWQKVMDNLSGRGCYFDIAFVLDKMKSSDTARELYRQNEDYFLFGTDTPWCDQERYVRLVRESETLTPEQKEKMFFRNILKLIDLP